MRLDQVISDDAAVDQMLLDDSLEDRRIALAVPRSFGIDDGDWTTVADAKAIGLGAQDAALFRESELLEPPLQVVPRRQPAIFLAALWLRLITTEKNMTARTRDAARLRRLLLGFAQNNVTSTRVPSSTKSVDAGIS